MRIEQAKNNQAEKREDSNFKTEKSVFDSSPSVQLKPLEAPKTPSTGAFAKILDEAREQSAREKEKLAGAKNDSADAVKAGETEEDRETERRAQQKLEEKSSRQESGGGEKQDEENSNALAANVFSGEVKPAAEVSAPAARSILHIADLERIVSFARAEKFAGATTVLIGLKHSVLEGLQIRLTLQENGHLKAEFLALNEQIKKQLKKRERELLEILRQRSSKFSEIDVLLAANG